MLNDYETKVMSAPKTKKLKINFPLRGHKAGDVVEIDVDAKGVPLARYWRDRIKESNIDGCVEFVKPKRSGK